MMRFPWLLTGFILGHLSQDPGTIALAHDFGAWLRCFMIGCEV